MGANEKGILFRLCSLISRVMLLTGGLIRKALRYEMVIKAIHQNGGTMNIVAIYIIISDFIKALEQDPVWEKKSAVHEHGGRKPNAPLIKP